MMMVLCTPLLLGSIPSKAQEQEIQQLLLDLEKLAQLKNILSDLKKGYEILKGGYQAIKNISEGSFNLHEAFLDGLLQVSPVVRNYKRVADIIGLQIRMVSTYKGALKQFKESGQFSPDEIQFLGQVYAHLFDQSVQNLEDLATVLTSGKLRMTDDERLEMVDSVWKEIQNEWSFLHQFNDQTRLLALGRAKEAADVGSTKGVYGIR
jgi:hypothetical protein